MDKRTRRLALLEAGAEPLGTGSPCADCGAPRTALNTGVCWSDAARTRLTFQSAVTRVRPVPLDARVQAAARRAGGECSKIYTSRKLALYRNHKVQESIPSGYRGGLSRAKHDTAAGQPRSLWSVRRPAR